MKNQKYSNKFEEYPFFIKLFFSMSAVAFWLVMIKDTEWLPGYGICFLISMIIIWQMPKRKINKIIILSNSLISVAVCYKLSQKFFFRWDTFEKLETVSSFFSLDHVFFVKCCSVLLFFFSIPFVLYLFCWLVSLFLSLDNKIFISDFRRINEGKGALRWFTVLCINVVIAIMSGTILMHLVYLLPTEPIDRNVERSAETFDEEGTYPILFSWCHSKLDNFTDAIMLLEAAYDADLSLTEKALLNGRGKINGINDPAETLVEHYVNGREFDTIHLYPRYWHGYHVFIKPLFYVATYKSVRILNGILQMGTVMVACWLLKKRNYKKIIIPLLISYLMIMPIAISMAFQYSSCFYVAVFTFIAILCTKQKSRIPIIFLWTGIATAFFDFLTYPTLTLGIPAVLYLSICGEEASERKISRLMKILFCWCFGYGAMWIGKWAVGSLLTDYNVIGNAVLSFLNRTSSSSGGGLVNRFIDCVECITKNITKFITTPFLLLVILYFIFNIRKTNSEHQKMVIVKFLLPYMLVAAIPFIWYSFALNHSFIHSWFTNKAIAVSIFSMMCGLADLRNSSRKTGDGKNG